MPDFRSMFDSNYIYAFDLAGKDQIVTIKEVKVGTLKNAQQKEERKPIAYFAESKSGRGLVLNKTNCRTIAGLYGNDVDNWIGKRIALFPTQCDAFNKVVDCIRVRPTVPKASAKTGALIEATEMPQPEAPEHLELREPGQDG